MPQPGSDRVDFERLMRESYRLVYRIAYSVLGNAEDAEEVTQDSFLAAYEKIGSLRDTVQVGLIDRNVRQGSRSPLLIQP